MPEHHRIINVFIDGRTSAAPSPKAEHERRAAIFDFLEDNRFVLPGGDTGPYNLHLSLNENRLLFDVRDQVDAPVTRFALALGFVRSLMRDYFVLCDGYYRAIKTLSASQIETIDMGRRSLHDEGAARLKERMASKAMIDMDTARRLFTLICALHLRG